MTTILNLPHRGERQHQESSSWDIFTNFSDLVVEESEKFKKMVIENIEIKAVDDLKPHEEIVPARMWDLLEKLRTQNRYQCPMLTDKSTRVILDGMHRQASMRILKINYTVCQTVDYSDPDIVLEQWARKAVLDTTRFNKLQNQFGLMPCQDEEVNGCTTKIYYGLKTYLFPDHEANMETMNFFCHEAGISQNPDVYIPMKKTHTATLCDELVVAPATLSKQQVLDTANAGKVFPPKTTRHTFPFRVILDIPLDFLRSITPRNQACMQEILRGNLYNSLLYPIPSHTLLAGDRAYPEVIFRFLQKTYIFSV